MEAAATQIIGGDRSERRDNHDPRGRSEGGQFRKDRARIVQAMQIDNDCARLRLGVEVLPRNRPPVSGHHVVAGLDELSAQQRSRWPVRSDQQDVGSGPRRLHDIVSPAVFGAAAQRTSVRIISDTLISRHAC